MEYEIIIRPKPILEFESSEDLQQWLDRERDRRKQEDTASSADSRNHDHFYFARYPRRQINDHSKT